MTEDTRPQDTAETPAEYEAPAIDQVVTPDDVEREVHYAGVPGPSNAPN